MGKVAVLGINYNYLQSANNLKKLFLMFEKLYIDDASMRAVTTSVGVLTESGDSALPRAKSNSLLEHNTSYKHNLNSILYLQQTGFIETIEVVTDSGKVVNDNVLRNPEDNSEIPNSSDAITRLISLLLQDRYEHLEVYPLLAKPPEEYKTTKKEGVLNFVLSKIPQPAESVSWEQLMDFKADPDTMNKYYALIKWVNTMSHKDSSSHELMDE
jgi:hypothetical protein